MDYSKIEEFHQEGTVLVMDMVNENFGGTEEDQAGNVEIKNLELPSGSIIKSITIPAVLVKYYLGELKRSRELRDKRVNSYEPMKLLGYPLGNTFEVRGFIPAQGQASEKKKIYASAVVHGSPTRFFYSWWMLPVHLGLCFLLIGFLFLASYNEMKKRFALHDFLKREYLPNDYQIVELT